MTPAPANDPFALRLPTAVGVPRILLDTNVWSRFAEANAGATLLGAAHKAKVKLIAAPSVLYELARIPDPVSRHRALRLITDMRWERLMPEAFSEASKIVGAIKHHHPEWMRSQPDLQIFDALKRDWARRNSPAPRRLRSHHKAGVWERFRNAPTRAATDLMLSEGELLDHARAEATSARREMLEQHVGGPGRLDSVYASFKAAPPGWDGQPFAHWRGETMESLSFYLLGQAEGPYIDWIAPFVKLELLIARQDIWQRFWLSEVSELQVPRQWIRWACRYLARFRKISSGTPCDIQLATYLPEADTLVSADKILIEFVLEAAKYAPVKLAAPHHVPPGTPAIDAVLEFIEQLRPRLAQDSGARS